MLAVTRAAAGQQQSFDVLEKTIPELAAAMAAGTVSSQALVRAYLARIDADDHRGPAINAIIAVNPDAPFEQATRHRHPPGLTPRLR